MLKGIGLLGLVITCGLMGIWKGKSLRQRIRLLDDFLRMMMEIKGQIGYFKDPLPDVFRRAVKNGDSRSFFFLDDLLNDFDEKEAEIAQIWPQKVKETYGKEPLTGEDLRIFSYPGEFLGQTDYENHLYHFAYMEEKLGKQIGEAKEAFRKKGPMYSRVGFFLGGILAAIFI